MQPASDKITITFVKSSIAEGARYQKRSRTRVKLPKAKSMKDGEEKVAPSAAQAPISEEHHAPISAQTETNLDSNCLANTRPRRQIKKVERYEPTDVVLVDDFSDDEDVSSSDDEE